jgi:hypothetical protein
MFMLQRIDKERRCKRPVAECFVRFLLNRAEAIYSQNVSKPLARMADCFPTSVTLSGSAGYRKEVFYSEVKGSGYAPVSVGQISETGRNSNHFQVSVPDRRSISTLSFELFTLSLSSFMMHGKSNSNERIPMKRVFTN